jgi:diguanylate cyclase (GGDEF)-like protein
VRRAERLRAQSLGDELTGLANRRGFLELARERLAQAERARQPAALFFIDLNGMKPVNDRLGHEAGDRLLADAAALLRGCFRGSDVIARLGGDEFVVLAPAVGRSDTAPLEARLRASVAAFNERAGRPYRVSMSIGCSIYEPSAPLGIEQLLAEADERMYARKRARQAAGAPSMVPARGEAGHSSLPARGEAGWSSPARADGAWSLYPARADAPTSLRPARGDAEGSSSLPARPEAPLSLVPTGGEGVPPSIPVRFDSAFAPPSELVEPRLPPLSAWSGPGVGWAGAPGRGHEPPEPHGAPAPEPRCALPPASGVMKAAGAKGPGGPEAAPSAAAGPAPDVHQAVTLGRIALGPAAPRRPSSSRA